MLKAYSDSVDAPGKRLKENPLFVDRELSDKEIIKGLNQGDESVLGYIYGKYVHDLYRFGNQISHHKEIVKDCIQDVFATLIRRKISIGKINSIKSYLYKSLYRAIIEKLKLERKYLIDHPILDHLSGFEIEISSESKVIHEEAYRLKVARVNEQLKKLSKKQKQAILLYYYEGFSHEEVAELMNLKNKNSVTKLVRRGLDSIRQNIVISLLILIYFSG
ncbi:RNA polymerase sigma factor [Fulvivirgaceae bacterium BMA10]|uniref:RNA polymerase sigma factor n=1 Tax=Splendidivirga corallicola TaxID=3051826 RepID=A0ABT8KH97_9BACT|nr:RNA polymerase sigma factor [Fulvivirgaceae bacterium BMA10]